MPEWKQEILKRLSPLRIDPAIIEELAQHLEARYEELLSSGLDGAAAYREALKELEHADVLSEELSRCDPPPRFEPAIAAA